MTNTDQNFAIENLKDDDQSRIKLIADTIRGHQKKDTDATFKLGALIDEATEVIGDDKTCENWLEKTLGITARHARNYRAVHRNLARFKPRCTRLAVSPTILFKLAHAEADQIDEVLNVFESGGRPRVQDVAAILSGTADQANTDYPVEDGPGLTGLAKYGAQVQRTRIARLKELLNIILLAVIEAYEPKLRGKAVVKSHLREKVRLQAEEAFSTLKHMIGTLQRDDHWAAAIGQLHLEEPDNDGGWAKLLTTLHGLERFEYVPASDAPDYLKDRAIPQLQWALGLDDENIQMMFAKAAEKNNPKMAKKSQGSATKRKPRPRATQQPVVNANQIPGQIAEGQSGAAA
ncbi:hypothetical protein [Labrenzia sp. PHM005]|uniref:hypothetical protein n=1 Tax=Labrenzia sp. PHM005 TaxID=2590016 RepID=UPI00114085C7|nr:hypothetical protein [Labrenzia sp. PHM005]QDG77710.1 hypothetical protein FJ695_18600 [Labrenzia sp. PHM005]